MSKTKLVSSRRVGLPPGSVVYLREKRVENARITVIDYDADNLSERDVLTPDECLGYIKKNTTTWINITGLHDASLIENIGSTFDIHPLVLEGILSSGQRPRLEDHGETIFCIVKMLYRGKRDDEIISEQVSLILGRDYLVTFQEMEGDVFDIIRERIRTGQGRIRTMGCDYLAYALLDAIVDNYFVVLEDMGDKIESLQDAVLARPEPKTLQAMHRLKRDVIFMRKSLWPLRELVSSLDKSENELIGSDLRPYLRDLYEHTFQVLDTVETWRDMMSSALDVYMTTVSNRMNEVMKVLTVIATIFIPLTFIAGIYGMNFEHMPELGWRFGYAGVWAVMLCAGLGMAIFFKRKKWW